MSNPLQNCPNWMTRKRCAQFLVIGILAYIGFYIPNSIFGGYFGPVAGNVKYSSGLSVRTAYLWEPFFGYIDLYNTSAGAFVWYPLIRFDQQFIHRPLVLENSEDFKKILSTNNPPKWHPELIAEGCRYQLKKAEWKSRCCRDVEFCVAESTNILGKNDRHFLAVALLRDLGTNAPFRLEKVRGKADEFGRRQVDWIMREITEVMLTNNTPAR